jgi:hypothetical protein
MGGDVDTRKSTTDVMFYLNSCLVTWHSQKQKVITLSSCEAEYIASTMAACEGVCLAQLLIELKNEHRITFLLKMHSQSTIALSKNLVFDEHSKHIDVRFHFIREYVGDGKLDIEHIFTEEHITDIMTKPLAQERLCELWAKLRIIKITKEL